MVLLLVVVSGFQVELPSVTPRATSPAYSNLEDYSDYEPADRSISPVNSEEYFSAQRTSDLTWRKSIEERHPKFFVKHLEQRKEYAHYESDELIVNGEPFVYSEEYTFNHLKFLHTIGVPETKDGFSSTGTSSTSSGDTGSNTTTHFKHGTL